MARDIKYLKQDIQKFILSTITKDMLQQFADHVKNTIYTRTKSGKGLDGKLKELSPAYIRYRSQRVLGPFASPKRSNLTFSGELLESIVAKVVGKKAIVEIESGQHGSGIGLRELAQYVTDAGRPFFGLTDREKKIFENFAKRLIRDNIRSQIKR